MNNLQYSQIERRTVVCSLKSLKILNFVCEGVDQIDFSSSVKYLDFLTEHYIIIIFIEARLHNTIAK